MPEVSELKEVGEAQLIHDEKLAQVVLDALPDKTAVLDANGMVVAANRAWRERSKENSEFSRYTAVGSNYLQFFEERALGDATCAKTAAEGIRAVFSGRIPFHEQEYPWPSPIDGSWYLLRVIPLAVPEGGVVVSYLNITGRKIAEERIAHQAAHDPLTGLANRKLFYSLLGEALDFGSVGSPSGVGVLYIDLDHFKTVNDAHGHDVGDEVLQAAARRLRNLIRPDDTAARIGGDEFAVVAPGMLQDHLESLGRRVTVELELPITVRDIAVSVGASVGAYLADLGESADEALRRADQSMYALKRMKRAD